MAVLMPNMLFANNCNTTLNGGITAVATSMVVTSATGFPVPTGSQYFYCTLADAATQSTIEIVKVTAVSGTTFTIVRGQDGTTGAIFASGAVVSLRLVAASLNDFPKLDEANTFTQAQTFSTPIAVGSGGTGLTSLTAGYIPYGNGTSAFASSAGLFFDGNNLGIGTNSPVGRLSVFSTTSLNSSITSWNNAYSVFGPNANSTTGAALALGYNTTLDQAELVSLAPGVAWKPLKILSSGLIFSSKSGVEAARIFDSGGVSIGNTTDPGAGCLSVNNNLLVGTTSVIAAFASPMIHAVNGAGGGQTQYACRNSAGTAGRSWQFGMSSGDQYAIYAFNGTTLTAGQYMSWGATSWTANSDERLKDIIEPITNAVQKLKSWRTVIGKYKTDEEGKRRVFFIAQDIQATTPEAVDATDPDRLGVQYTDTIPVVAAAVNEHTETIDAMQKTIISMQAALKAANIAGF